MICCGSPQKEQLKAEEEEDHDSDSQTVCAGVQTEDNLQSLKVKPTLKWQKLQFLFWPFEKKKDWISIV